MEAAARISRGGALRAGPVGLLPMAIDFPAALADLESTLASIEKVLDLPAMRAEVADLEVAASAPDLWDDPAAAQKVTSRLSFVEGERRRVGGAWVQVAKEQSWLWVVAGDLDGYDGAAIRDWGHLRWKVENNAFGELTQHWHLTHCAHHHPIAVVALLWIKILAFTLFHAFALLHGKLIRLGRATLKEVRQQIYRSLLCGEPMLLFSG